MQPIIINRTKKSIFKKPQPNETIQKVSICCTLLRDGYAHKVHIFFRLLFLVVAYRVCIGYDGTKKSFYSCLFFSVYIFNVHLHSVHLNSYANITYFIEHNSKRIWEEKKIYKLLQNNNKRQRKMCQVFGDSFL